MSLYIVHRPKTFKSVTGNESAIASLKQMLTRDFPHVVLFHGESGCGKTTLARIVSKKLGVDFGSSDYTEINGSNNRGIDFFREQVHSMRIKPFLGKRKVYIIDECHRLTKDAMDCLLKPLEDTPRHTYVFLCTTEPQKLLKAILTRCTKIECKPLNEDDIVEVLNRICKLAKNPVPTKILELIADNCDGSSREAINKLEALMGLSDKKMEEIAVADMSCPAEVISLCRGMMSGKMSNWKKIANILKSLDADPETTRRQVMGYANVVLLKGSMKAYCILDAFREPFYNTGKPGLTLACFEALNTEDSNED